MVGLTGRRLHIAQRLSLVDLANFPNFQILRRDINQVFFFVAQERKNAFILIMGESMD